MVCYIDDILITGADEEEHLWNLEEVLKRLQQHGIIRMKKCSFSRNLSSTWDIDLIDAKGLHTTSKKVEAIQLAPAPKDHNQLRSFLGLLHYYSKFMPNLAFCSPAPEHSPTV